MKDDLHIVHQISIKQQPSYFVGIDLKKIDLGPIVTNKCVKIPMCHEYWCARSYSNFVYIQLFLHHLFIYLFVYLFN